MLCQTVPAACRRAEALQGLDVPPFPGVQLHSVCLRQAAGAPDEDSASCTGAGAAICILSAPTATPSLQH